ncbi:hypothetical protein ACFL5A_00160 [Gemmatimonadota bacterium]
MAVWNGSAGGQDIGSESRGAGVFLGPFVGMILPLPSAEPAQAVGLHLLVDRGARLSFGGKFEGNWIGSHHQENALAADLLLPLVRVSERNLVLGSLGAIWAGGEAGFTMGLRASGWAAKYGAEAGEAPNSPDIAFLLDLRGGIVRTETSRGRIWKGMGLAEVMMVLPMRIGG